jgi:hypothetical protein
MFLCNWTRKTKDHSWLHKHNPIIDWKKGEITFKPFQIDWRRLIEKGKRIRQEQQPKIEEVVDEEELKNWTTLPIVEDKLGVYIELLETDVWIHRTNITTELAIEENSKKRINNWYQRNITNIWTSSTKKRHTAFPN